MWFDVGKALAEIEAGDFSAAPNVAVVAGVATPLVQIAKPEAPCATPTVAQKDGNADGIIDLLEAAETTDTMHLVMREYSGAIERIAAQADPLDAVRAIHVRNFYDYKLTWVGK